MSWTDTLQAAWYKQERVPYWTLPLAWLYGQVMAWRGRLYRRGWLRQIRLSIPVIVVGNISIGGTGKTPLTIALAAQLREHGWYPGVVSRGYGGQERGPVLLDQHADPRRFGDEPCLIYASGVPVAIGRDRPAAAALLLKAGCNVVIADDGLQHYRLARDLEICVLDGKRRLGNQRLLPAGPLREPPTRLASVDWRVCHDGQPGLDEVPMQLKGNQLHNLYDGRQQPLSALRGCLVHVIAGIGHPERFFQNLLAQGLIVQAHVFADHYAYSEADFIFDDGRPLLMTEKDAIKCASWARRNWWSLPVQADLPSSFYQEVADRLAQLETPNSLS